MRVANVSVNISLMLLIASSSYAQVEPQIGPYVPTQGCAPFVLYKPSLYSNEHFKPSAHIELIATIADCMVRISEAVQATMIKGQSTPTTQSDAKQPAAPEKSTTATDTSKQSAPIDSSAKAASSSSPTASSGATTTSSAQIKASEELEEQIHTELIREYLSYRRLKRWNAVYQGSDILIGQRATLNRPFIELSEILENALIKHGITQPFSAELVTAFVLQPGGTPVTRASPSTGATGTDATPTGSGTTTSAAGFVEWQSLHFYADPDRWFDIDLAGGFGFEPVLALIQAASTSGTTATDPTVMTNYQQAFVWSMAVEPNFRVADKAEVAAFARVGQSILNSTQTLLENGTTATVAVSASNNTSRAEIFYEYGAALSIYPRALDILHLTKGLLSPSFAVSGGFKTDNRFSAAGPLSAFNAPEKRVFMRLDIEPLQVISQTQNDKTFNIGLSVDFDAALHRQGDHVPSGTRILIRGDLNLFKATQTAK